MIEWSNCGISYGNTLSLLFHAQVLQVVHFTALFLEKIEFNFHVQLVTDQVVHNCESLM